MICVTYGHFGEYMKYVLNYCTIFFILHDFLHFELSRTYFLPLAQEYLLLNLSFCADLYKSYRIFIIHHNKLQSKKISLWARFRDYPQSLACLQRVPIVNKII